MTKEFEIAIEELYKTFAKYPFNSTIEGCPCCDSDTDKSTLHSKQLRKLEDEDISRYALYIETRVRDHIKSSGVDIASILLKRKWQKSQLTTMRIYSPRLDSVALYTPTVCATKKNEKFQNIK